MPTPRPFRTIEPFCGLPPEATQRLDAECRWASIGPDTLVIDADAGGPHGVFVLAEGQVDVHRRDGNGEPVHLGRLTAVDCFGEFAAIHGVPGSASVRTNTHCLVAEIDPAVFVALLGDYPALSLKLLGRAVSLLKSLDDDLVRLRLAQKRIDEVYRNAVMRTL